MTAISAMSTEPTRRPSTPGWMGADHTVSVKKCHLKVLSAHQLWTNRKTTIETSMARTTAPLLAKRKRKARSGPVNLALRR